jgi:hypothetical protein
LTGSPPSDSPTSSSSDPSYLTQLACSDDITDKCRRLCFSVSLKEFGPHTLFCRPRKHNAKCVGVAGVILSEQCPIPENGFASRLYEKQVLRPKLRRWSMLGHTRCRRQQSAVIPLLIGWFKPSGARNIVHNIMKPNHSSDMPKNHWLQRSRCCTQELPSSHPLHPYVQCHSRTLPWGCPGVSECGTLRQHAIEVRTFGYCAMVLIINDSVILTQIPLPPPPPQVQYTNGNQIYTINNKQGWQAPRSPRP